MPGTVRGWRSQPGYFYLDWDALLTLAFRKRAALDDSEKAEARERQKEASKQSYLKCVIHFLACFLALTTYVCL